MSNPTKTLRRSPGKEVIAQFALATRVSKPKTDPNGYYQILGLDPRQEWSQEDIKRAFRARAKVVHPDGSDPDARAYDKLSVAYAVLRDPEMRRRYDELQDRLWLDKDVINEVVKRWAKARAEGKVKAEAITDVLREKLAAPAPTTPVARSFDTWAYYYYDDEDVPPRDVRETWVSVMMEAAWAQGITDVLHLGFTNREPHLVDRPWGTVMMVSGDPSTEMAQGLIKKL